jgi:hypothetical protein
MSKAFMQANQANLFATITSVSPASVAATRTAIGNSSAGGNFGMGSVAHALPAYPSAYGNIPSSGSNQAHMQQGAYGYAWGVVGSGISPMGQPFYPNQQHGSGSNGGHE